MTVSPRKTPSQSRSQDTVAAILEGAARILEEQGFEGYGTNEIARRAGVSIGSLYQYFPGKDAVTGALIQRETAILLAETADLAQLRSGREGLKRMVEAAVAHQLRRPKLAVLLDIAEMRLPFDDENRCVAARLIETLMALLRKSDVPPLADIAEAAGDLLAIAKGMIDAAGQRGETNAKKLIERVFGAAIGYIEEVSAATRWA
jgi:AcrR family transcriptional regulator